MKRIAVLVLLLFVIVAPAYGAACTDDDTDGDYWDDVAPGEWCQVPNTDMETAALAIGSPYSLSGSSVILTCGGTSSTDPLINIMKAWNSGAYDSARGKFIVWGGGHTDYCGNEIWEFDVNTFVWEYSSPVDPAPLSGSDCETASGRPKTGHTYDSLFFVPTRGAGEFCLWGIQGCYPSGTISNDAIWCNVTASRNPGSNTGTQGWTKVIADAPGNYRKSRSHYNSADGFVYTEPGETGDKLRRWDPSGTTITDLGGPSYSGNNDLVCALDPTNDVMDCIGGGKHQQWDLTTGVRTTKASGGCTGPGNYPGYEYDTNTGKLTCWASGSTVYQYDASTNAWNSCPANTGSPSSPQNNGTYGRWQYIPDKDGYVLVNTTKEDVWLYKLPGSCASSPLAECEDGLDNDGDGECDWDHGGANTCTEPDVTLGDTGCDSAGDTNETDCGDDVCTPPETNATCGVDCPLTTDCNNGIDDDGDTYCDNVGDTCTDGSTAGDAGCSIGGGTSEVDCGDDVCSPGEAAGGCTADCAVPIVDVWATAQVAIPNTDFDSTTDGNPFDVDLRVTLTNQDTATVITQWGYYDGGNCSSTTTTRCALDSDCLSGQTCVNEIWEFRFLCSEVGTWDWDASSGTGGDATTRTVDFLSVSDDYTLTGDTDLDTASGSLTCVASGLSGPLEPIGNRWRYTQSLEYVAPISYHSEYFFRNPAPFGHTIASMLDWFEVNGATMIGTDLLMAVTKGDRFKTNSQEDRIYLDVSVVGDTATPDLNTMWLPTWDRMNDFYDAAALRDIGLLLRLYHDNPNGPATNLGLFGGTMNEFRLMRYVIARFAAHPTVVWDTGIDIAEERSNPWIEAWVVWMLANDPWQHPVASRYGGGSGGIDAAAATHDSDGTTDVPAFATMLSKWEGDTTEPIFWTDHWRDQGLDTAGACSGNRGTWCPTLACGAREEFCGADRQYALRGAAWQVAFIPGGFITGNRKPVTGSGSAYFTELELAASPVEPFTPATDFQIRNDFISNTIKDYGSMTPDLALTVGTPEVYAMSDGGNEFVFYVLQSQAGAAFNVDLSTGVGTATTYRWYSTTESTFQAMATVPGNSASETLTPPDTNDWIAYIEFDNTPVGSDDNDLIVQATTDWSTATPSSIYYEIPVHYIGGIDPVETDPSSTGLATDANYDATITVQYKKAADSTWLPAVDASRIADRDQGISDTNPSGGSYPAQNYDRFAGAIWGLDAGTSYDVRFTINDPDGYTEIRDDTTSTAVAPITLSTLGAADYTLDGSTAGQLLADLRELLDGDGSGDAAPGEWIELTGNFTNDGTSYMIDIGVSGTSVTAPIGIRCNSRSVVINGDETARRVFSFDAGASHVYIENCTIMGMSGEGFAIRGGTGGGNTGIVIRHNLMRNTAVFVNSADAGGILWDNHPTAANGSFYIEDNFLEGPNSFPWKQTARVEGIRINGDGNTVAHNFIRGMGDSIGYAAVNPSDVYTIKNNVIYGNDIWWSKDDAIEGDHSHSLIIHHNRVMNYNTCFSLQPSSGGPFYFVRNICWSSHAVKHFKMTTESGKRTQSLKSYHNIFSGWWQGSGNKSFGVDMRNNLWVQAGLKDDGVTIGTRGALDTATKYYGIDNGTNGASPQVGPIWNYNRYNYDGQWRLNNTSSGDFAAHLAKSWNVTPDVDDNSAIIAEPIFAEDQTPYSITNNGLGTVDLDRWMFLDSGFPHASSTGATGLINNGVAITGINETTHPRDPATGVPDIGAYELENTTDYPYGLLTWSYTVSGAPGDTAVISQCEDGLDNDWDGLIDYAGGAGDPGCTSDADQSEVGETAISPACDDGLDNDGDKLFNSSDSGCASACDLTEDLQSSETCAAGGECDGQSAGVACTDTIADCYDAQCNGAGFCDQGWGFEGSGFACNDATVTECDNADTCNGAGGCSSNPVTIGTACSDGEMATNGDLESWASGTDLNNWTEVITTGTIAQESTNVHGGTYSLEMDKTGSTGGLYFHQSYTLVPGARYRIRLWYKATAAATNGWRPRLWNSTNATEYDFAIEQWVAQGINGTNVPMTTSWALFDYTITIPGANDPGDSYTFVLSHYYAANSGEQLYIDDITFEGGRVIDTTCDNPDTCDGAGACDLNYETLGTTCEGTYFCRDAETCGDAGFCSETSGTAHDCSDAIACTSEVCAESTGTCDITGNDAACVNALFCADAPNADEIRGAQTCNIPTGCVEASSIPCNDGNICTDDACNDTIDACGFVFDSSNDPSCDTKTLGAGGEFSISYCAPRQCAGCEDAEERIKRFSASLERRGWS